jgi:transposase
VTRPTVHHWLKRFGATGTVARATRPGRPRVVNGAASQRAAELLLEGQTSFTVVQQLHEEGHIARKVSRSTIIARAREHAKSTGQPLVVHRGPPAKGLTQKNKVERLAFCKANKKRDWSNVLSSLTGSGFTSNTLAPRWQRCGGAPRAEAEGVPAQQAGVRASTCMPASAYTASLHATW